MAYCYGHYHDFVAHCAERCDYQASLQTDEAFEEFWSSEAHTYWIECGAFVHVFQ
jgi:hypothetical protein